MDRAVVFLDGGYIDKIKDYYIGREKLDYIKLSEQLCSPECMRWRTYYYHCPPYQDDPPTQEQRERKAGYDRYADRLGRLDRFILREGRLRLVKREPYEVEQKGVDVLLACDLVRLSATHQIHRAIIVGGDADFVPAVKIAKDEGVLCVLYYKGDACSPHLRDVCDERRLITEEMIRSSILSRPTSPKVGDTPVSRNDSH